MNHNNKLEGQEYDVTNQGVKFIHLDQIYLVI